MPPQLGAFMAGFEASDVLVVTHEDILADPTQVLRKVHQHVGLPQRDVAPLSMPELEAKCVVMIVDILH